MLSAQQLPLVKLHSHGPCPLAMFSGGLAILRRMTFVDTSPEKFYDSLLSYEAPSDEFAPLAEPHAMEEPEEVPPEDYKVGTLA
jgi:hypothetical protein